MTKEYWNERYATDEYIFGKEPNVFFKSVIGTLPPGKLLVPAAGEGRDAVYAAKLGWDVLALDLSSIARDKALNFAKESNVTIRYELGNIADFKCEPNIFDAVALIYFHLPPALRHETHTSLAQCVKPGGTIILEAYNKRQINNDSGGPKQLDMLMSSEELANDFTSLRIIQNEEIETILQEGMRHVGKADVIRLVAKK